MNKVAAYNTSIRRRKGSIGFATYKYEEDQQDFIDRADNALYRAKEEGRDRACQAVD